MPINRIACTRQLLTQQDFNDRGVQFHLTKGLDVLAEINAPLDENEQVQLSAFLLTINVLRDAILLATDNLTHEPQS